MSNEQPIVQEKILTDEEKNAIFETALDEGIAAALEMVRENFEDSPDPQNHLAFHNVAHTRNVVRRYDAIMDVLKGIDQTYTERAHKLGRFAAANHDTVQKWEPATQSQPSGGLEKIVRKRFTGANESESVAHALAIMTRVNEEAGVEIFTADDVAIVENAIDVTVPGWSVEKGTVVQPRLTPASSLVTRAVALADIGSAGLDGPEAYLAEGDALFREENLDIADAVTRLATLTEEQKEFFANRMKRWGEVQVKFAEGRKSMLEDELLAQYPEETHETLRKLFDKFDDSINAERERVERRRGMTFEELARDMGYELS